MGLGPTATVGFRGPDGEWVAVSPSNALPVQGSGAGAGWTPPEGTNGQVLKYDAEGNLVPGTDNNTTYTAISESEITAGTATTARAITGQRAQAIVDKARTDVLLGEVITQAEYDALGANEKPAPYVYLIVG